VQAAAIAEAQRRDLPRQVGVSPDTVQLAILMV